MQEVNIVLEPLRALLVQIASYVPRLAIALAILVAGWLIGKAARFAVVKALRAFNFHVLTERAGVDGFLQQSGTSKDTSDLFGSLIFWLVIIGSLIVSFNGLGLTQVTDVLSRVLLFMPKLLVGLLVIVFGAYFARFMGSAVEGYCRSARITDGELLGKIAQVAIIIFIVLI